jgi:hypothetical protein
MAEVLPRCHQCDRPALVEYSQSGVKLCLDCNEKFQAQQDRITEQLEREHNRVLDEMDMISGIPSSGGRYPPRRKVEMAGTFNNIHIDRSTVGVVNTGTINGVDLAISTIQSGGDNNLASAIRELTEAIAATRELDEEQRTQALQLVEVVAQEATKPKDARRSAVIKPILAGLAEAIKVGSSLSTLWARLEPVFTAAFS